MFSEPKIFPLDVDGLLCAVHDDRGKIIGTGSREVCEVLLRIINRSPSTTLSEEDSRKTTVHYNVRAAIVI